MAALELNDFPGALVEAFGFSTHDAGVLAMLQFALGYRFAARRQVVAGICPLEMNQLVDA